jgi:hypothetical protein
LTSKPLLRGFALKFTMNGGIIYPIDPKLHALAIQYAETALAIPINFADYEGLTVVAEIDECGNPTKVVAMNARVPRWDYPVWRASSEAAMKVLIDRTRATLDDEGRKGQEVFVYLADKEDKTSRCPKWRKFLRLVGAENASRWRVRI